VISLFVFDLDGTLIDSQRDIAESANAVLEEYGCAPLPEATVTRMIGDGAATLIARAFAAARCDKPADALERFLSAYRRRLLRFTQVYDGIPDLLDALSGTKTLAVLTNKPHDATKAILEGLKLAHYFEDRVLAGDGPLPRKPNAAGLTYLMRRLDAAPSGTLMVGDSIVDFRTARNAGALACVARYGFGYASFPVAELTPADRIIDRPRDLLATL
jgi:phosphoglycolate phosphatase